MNVLNLDEVDYVDRAHGVLPRMGNVHSEYLLALTFQVVKVVPEVQAVSLLGSAGDVVDFFLLGQNLTVKIGTDTPATIQSALESLITVRAFLSRFATRDCFSLRTRFRDP